MRASFHASAFDGMSAEMGQPPPCSEHPVRSPPWWLSQARCRMGPSRHRPELVLQLASGGIAAGGYGQNYALHAGGGEMSQAGRQELPWVSPGRSSLVGSPEGRAGSCRCLSLPVGFKSCISNFFCYFREILPKAVCITDTLSLQGVCGMAGAPENAVTVKNTFGERKHPAGRFIWHRTDASSDEFVMRLGSLSLVPQQSMFHFGFHSPPSTDSERAGWWEKLALSSACFVSYHFASL